MNRIFSIVLALNSILIFTAGNGFTQTQVDSFSLTNGRSFETLKIKPGSYLQFTSRLVDFTVFDSIRYLQGAIRAINDTSVVIAPKYDLIIKSYHSDSVLYIEKHQQHPNYSVNMAFSNIEKINYQTRQSQNWSGIGISSMLIGGIISLFVAPLVSINYKDGGFNSTRYLKCASVGLGFVAIGIPLAACNKEREYYLNPQKDGKSTTTWKFKK